MSIVYLDGEFLSEEKAKIPVMDRGFLLGDGVYTTIQVREGQPLFLDMHLERLQAHCKSLNIHSPMIEKQAIESLIEKNGADKGIWRLKILITGGEDPLMRLPERDFGHLIFTLKPFSPPIDSPLRLGLFPFPIQHCHAFFKSLAHLNRYYVMEYAHQQNLDDAVTTTEKGMVLEASFGNLLWLDPKNKTAKTPHPELPLHFGVTVTVLSEALKQEGYRLEQVKVPLKDISTEDFLFRVNTMSGIRAIASIEETSYSLDRSLEGFLRELFEESAGLMNSI